MYVYSFIFNLCFFRILIHMRLKIQVENLEAIEIDDGNTWQHLANVTSALKIESNRPPTKLEKKEFKKCEKNVKFQKEKSGNANEIS